MMDAPLALATISGPRSPAQMREPASKIPPSAANLTLKLLGYLKVLQNKKVAALFY